MKILWIFIKRIIKIFLIFMFLCFILIIVLWFFPIGNELAKGVNQQAIASLKLGMSKKEVLSILGAPILEKKSKERGFNQDIFIYGKSGIITGTDVHILFKDNHMYLVYIGFMDASFYYCTKEYCGKSKEPFDFYNWFIPKR